ncbi:hypothetical protein LTR37_018708 [Vermiconidia calcicola]|uniref:Uncharacterized protein n=1 Tax=Vermiconidia calcicola TaxID=1690605 RepID=A0ACC3MGA0_9PEZI|nr:hypothetical protein LTR37_018708 [Vermiconidia calcicola]
MGNSPNPVPKATSTNESESSGGFRSFWRKLDKTAQKQKVTFVQEDFSSKRQSSRISRLLRQGSTATSQDHGEPGTAQKRRQQVYSAQERHRNRKAEYVQTLEAEVARLQHLDAMVNNEKNILAQQNQAMKELLASKSLDIHLNLMDLSSSSQLSDGLSHLGGAMVDIGYDPEIGQERTILDFDDMFWSSDETSAEDRQLARRARYAPVPGNSWAALDFILALEWPCREHIKHAHINPNANVQVACAQGGFHGHALTATAAVYQCSLPCSNRRHARTNRPGDSDPAENGLHLAPQEKWQLPHSEIEKLVELSEMLDLDDELMTPAQAYSAIRETIPNQRYLRPSLELLKKPLASLVQCHGFGACMDAAM